MVANLDPALTTKSLKQAADTLKSFGAGALQGVVTTLGKTLSPNEIVDQDIIDRYGIVDKPEVRTARMAHYPKEYNEAMALSVSARLGISLRSEREAVGEEQAAVSCSGKGRRRFGSDERAAGRDCAERSRQGR